jgi:hypothetical protein
MPNSPSAPACHGTVVALDADEMLVGAAYARLVSLIDWLLVAPFDRDAYGAVQTYLDRDAWEAADAFDRIAGRDVDSLRQRIAAIENTLGDRTGRVNS